MYMNIILWILILYNSYKCISKSGANFISQTTIISVNIVVDIDFSNGGKHLLPHKQVWINNEYVIKELDLDGF